MATNQNDLKAELERLRQSQGQSGSQQSQRGLVDILADNISRPFNKGLAAIPAMLPGGDDLQQTLEYLGMVSPKGQEATGLVPTAMEFMGGSVIPGGGLQSMGREVIKRGIPVARQTVPQFLASQTAANPAATLAADVAGSFTGAGGGEVAKQFTDDPGIIASSELAAGLGVPAVASQIPRAAKAVAEVLPVTGTAIRAGRSIKESFNTKARQIRRLQELSADPEKASAKIDVNSPVSPARQTEEPRVIALEEKILHEAPANVAQAHRQKMQEAADKATQNARYFSGDTEEPWSVVQKKGADQVKRVQKRADKALEDADQAIAQIDSGASPRDISRVERERLETALHTARKEESAVWNELDQNATAQATNTRKAYDELQAAESELTFGRNVPEDVKAILAKADDGTLTLKDLQSIRSELNDQIRSLRADGQWNKARILGKFQDSLLDDLSAIDSTGVDRARDFSRQLNEKFTQGEVGKILKFEESGVRAVDAPETLSQLFKGESATRGIQQFVKASPESKDSIAEFVKNRYILQATKPDGGIDLATSKRAIDRLRNQGVFEEFPELEGQLQKAAQASQKAANYQKRAAIVKQRGGARLEQGSNESLASTFLKHPVEKRAAELFKSKNPVLLARKLRSAMRGNEPAEMGLRRAAAEQLLKQAERTTETGETVITGIKYGNLIRENLPTLRALGFNNTQITRMKRSATILRQLQIKPEKGAVSAVMEDNPAWFLEIPARVLGARVGGKVGASSSGGSIQTANIFASRFKQVLSAVTVDRAKKGLIDMVDNKELWKAFMLGEKAPKVEQEKALKAIETWLYGLGVDVAADATEESS